MKKLSSLLFVFVLALFFAGAVDSFAKSSGGMITKDSDDCSPKSGDSFLDTDKIKGSEAFVIYKVGAAGSGPTKEMPDDDPGCFIIRHADGSKVCCDWDGPDFDVCNGPKGLYQRGFDLPDDVDESGGADETMTMHLCTGDDDCSCSEVGDKSMSKDSWKQNTD